MSERTPTEPLWTKSSSALDRDAHVDTRTRNGGIGTAETTWVVEEAVALPGPEGDTGRAMSQEPADVVRAAEAAFNQREVDAFVALVEPEVEWEAGLPGTPTYRGHEGVRQMFRDVETSWEDWEVQATLEAHLGDAMVVEWKMRGRGRTTGVPVEGRQFVAVELRDGLASRLCAFQTVDEALEAVGLRE